MVFISSLDPCSPVLRIMTRHFGCSNKEKGKVNRQRAVKKKGPFTDFQEDLIKDLFERSASSFIHIQELFVSILTCDLDLKLIALPLAARAIPSLSKPNYGHGL